MLCLASMLEAQTLPLYNLQIALRDVQDGTIVTDAAVYLQTEDKGKTYGTVSDAEGNAKLTLPQGNYELYVSHLLYKPYASPLHVTADTLLVLQLEKQVQVLREVEVKASESRGLSSSSMIGREAMQHLQPTSLADLMELLPGGMAQDPNMTSAGTITLRETGSLNANGAKSQQADYATHALGTLFLVDGAPINTDANLQYTPQSSSNSTESTRDITNKGVDMRTISTDDIEKVEIIRGIPSVVYGNLTSGVVNITKVRRPTKLSLRFKADSKSMLVSAGKGFALDSTGKKVFNVDANVLNAYADPRNTLENYKRATFSTRYTAQHTLGDVWLKYSPAVNYTGSFDNYKEDPDLNYGGIDTYQSYFQNISLSMGLQLRVPSSAFFKGLDINASASQQFDRLERTKLVSPDRVGIAPASSEEGEQDAHLIFGEYIADYVVDGKPFSSFLKATAHFQFNTGILKQNVRIGSEWNLSKNFGKGALYDLSRPLSASGWGARPRAYNTIPALQNLAFYAEDELIFQLSNHVLEARAGLRGTALPGLSESYAMHGKVYVDPRLNLQWTLPAFSSKAVKVSFSGGVGRTSRMPTLNYLYPDPSYYDILQLAYYSQNNPQENSRYYILSYKQDATNYDLEPARNLKWEVRTDWEMMGNRLWVCFFMEKLSSGFRYSNRYDSYAFKDYDETAISDAALDGPPQLENVPYTERKKLAGYRFVENGSRQDKMGVEFELALKRIRVLRTAFTFSGAWFRSIYSNSRPMYYAQSGVYGDRVLSEYYVGLYDWNDGRINEQFSTNLLMDTQIPEWGLIFSASVQAMWYVSTQRMQQNGTPYMYKSYLDGLDHPYTPEAVASDPILLNHLYYSVPEAAYNRYTIPPALYVNLKITKKVKDMMTMAIFVNKLFDYTPDFERNGILIRRNVTPYFGMEMTWTI